MKLHHIGANCTLSPSSSIYIRTVKKGSSTDTFYKPRERIRFSEEVVCSARVQNIFPAYSLRDTIGSKVIFTMGFQPSCHAILRKHTLHSHLIWKLCRFHGAWYQGKQGEEVRKRKKKGGINRIAARSCCFYASKALLSKVGEGSGNAVEGVGEFFDRSFLDLARVIKPNAPQPTAQKHHNHHHPFIPLETFFLTDPFTRGSLSLFSLEILLILCIYFPDGGFFLITYGNKKSSRRTIKLI